MRCDRGVDLGDQLALAVAGAQLDRAVGLRRGAVGEIGVILVLVLQVLQRVARLFQDVVLPDEQLGAEIVALPLIHEGFFVGGPVAVRPLAFFSGGQWPFFSGVRAFFSFSRNIYCDSVDRDRTAGGELIAVGLAPTTAKSVIRATWETCSRTALTPDNPDLGAVLAAGD